MADDLARLEHDWNALGDADPLWAVLTDPSKRGGGWETGAFFEHGEREIAALMHDVERLAPGAGRGLALDFGCGVGRLSRALADRFEGVVGVDIAPSMLRRARDLNADRPNCTFVHHGAADLAFVEDGTVDLVYSNITLQHIPGEPARAYVAEFVRVLAPGGLAVFQVPSGPDASVRGLARRVSRLVPRAILDPIRRARHGGAGVMRMHALPVAEVARVVETAGGRIVECRVDGATGRGWISRRYAVSGAEGRR